MTNYEVEVFREEELWVATIAGVGATDMLRFADLDVEVRDYISGMTDADPHTFDLRWHYLAGDDDVTDLVLELSQVEHQVTAATARRDQLRREIIARMSAGGLSQRTIGDVLGLSHQRVNQLANTS